MAMNIITDFIQHTDYDLLPDAAVAAVKRAFIDTIGVCIAGTKEDAGRLVIEYARENQGAAKATVIGGGFMTTAADAALVNGTALHALDYDDTGCYTQGHPSAPVVPAILAIAEENGNTGKEIIAAYVVGVEVFSRLSRTMPMLHLTGFHPTSVIGTVAAAASAAKLMGLRDAQIEMTLGMAASQACGLIKNFGSMTKPFHVGRAASNGILAAKLAAKGFTAATGIFEGALSFRSSFSKSQEGNVPNTLRDIGSPLAIVEPGISIKKYPTCSLSHRAIDAILFLIKKYQFNSDSIESIDCRISPRAIAVLRHNNPRSGLEAKFSVPFALACALKFNSVSVSHFTNAIVNSDEIRTIMEKVKVGVHPDWKDGEDGRPDVVTVTLEDGERYSHSVEIPHGNAKMPLSDEAIVEKYRACASTSLNDASANEVLDFIRSLEYCLNIDCLMSSLRGGRRIGSPYVSNVLDRR